MKISIKLTNFETCFDLNHQKKLGNIRKKETNYKNSRSNRVLLINSFDFQSSYGFCYGIDIQTKFAAPIPNDYGNENQSTRIAIQSITCDIQFGISYEKGAAAV